MASDRLQEPLRINDLMVFHFCERDKTLPCVGKERRLPESGQGDPQQVTLKTPFWVAALCLRFALIAGDRPAPLAWRLGRRDPRGWGESERITDAAKRIGRAGHFGNVG